MGRRPRLRAWPARPAQSAVADAAVGADAGGPSKPPRRDPGLQEVRRGRLPQTELNRRYAIIPPFTSARREADDHFHEPTAIKPASVRFRPRHLPDPQRHVAGFGRAWGDRSRGARSRACSLTSMQGFTTFDLADHYGPAEDFIGEFRRRLVPAAAATRLSAVQAFTKWVPPPFRDDPRGGRGAIDRSLRRMNVDTLDLLQFHWWDYGDERLSRRAGPSWRICSARAKSNILR